MTTTVALLLAIVAAAEPTLEPGDTRPNKALFVIPSIDQALSGECIAYRKQHYSDFLQQFDLQERYEQSETAIALLRAANGRINDHSLTASQRRAAACELSILEAQLLMLAVYSMEPLKQFQSHLHREVVRNTCSGEEQSQAIERGIKSRGFVVLNTDLNAPMGLALVSGPRTKASDTGVIRDQIAVVLTSKLDATVAIVGYRRERKAGGFDFRLVQDEPSMEEISVDAAYILSQVTDGLSACASRARRKP